MLIMSPIIQSTLIKWLEKSVVVQRQFDQDTKGGNDPVAQNKWSEKISAQLNTTGLHLR
jgi:hypothetical protein